MKTMMIQKVRDSIFKVMETMFYFTVEENKDLPENPGALFDMETLRACRVSFSGDQAGNIFLLIPDHILADITRNFLGEDRQDLPEELTDGTLKEALNMIAGSALSQFDKTGYMGLGIPEMVNPGDLEMTPEMVAFETGQGLMAAYVSLDA